ncbi:MAG: hypothetical protein IT305_23630 [Chloroflexi bacterium]|nr:hypothetical protein [Chloroflexota bacterium]
MLVDVSSVDVRGVGSAQAAAPPGTVGLDALRPVLVVGAPGTPLSGLEQFFGGLRYVIKPLADDTADNVLFDLLNPGIVVTTHLPYRSDLSHGLAGRATRVVLIERDPRDVACALASRSMALDEQVVSAVTDRLHGVLTGDDTQPPLRARLSGYRAWHRHAGVIAIRYEDIAGPSVGGDEATQLETLIRLAAALEWRGSALMLGRSLTLADLPVGRDGPWDEVAAWSRYLPASTQALLRATLREAILAGGYDEPAPAAVPGPSGALSGLLAAMANEHEAAVASLVPRPDGASAN